MNVYFDSSATSLKKPPAVGLAVYQALTSQSYGNPARGAHSYSLASYRAVYASRAKIASLFNVPDPSLVIYTAGATMALNIALKGLLASGDHVITTAYEHNSVLRPLYQLAQEDVSLSVVGCHSPSGAIDYKSIEKLITPATKMIVCSHASNVIGNVLDLEKIQRLCSKYSLLLVVDAAQTAGVIPIDMVAQGIDVLCLAGHKSLLGPSGVGCLCLKEPLVLTPLLVGGSGMHSQAHEHPQTYPEALEAGTLNFPGIVGLAAGVEYVLAEGVETLGEKTVTLASLFYQGIQELTLLTFYGDYQAEVRTGVVAFTVGTVDSAIVADYLDEHYQIAVRPGLHCAPLLHEALGTSEQGLVRFSFSSFNTIAEVDYGVAAIREMCDQAERGIIFE